MKKVGVKKSCGLMKIGIQGILRKREDGLMESFDRLELEILINTIIIIYATFKYCDNAICEKNSKSIKSL